MLDFLSQIGQIVSCGNSDEFARDSARAGYSLVSPKDDADSKGKAKEDSGRPEDVSSDVFYAEVAASKALHILTDQTNNQHQLEKGNVYVAAIAMPQVARSAGWSLGYTELAIRSFFFLFVNVAVQCFLLYMLSSEERIWHKYGGQMNLCDFAYGIQSCPDGSNCRGPGGTSFSPARIYAFPIWQTRTFIRDALATLFPERESEIYDQVDPGEYGLESYHLRLLCCYLFILGLWSDFKQTLNMLRLIWGVPSEDGLWASYEPPPKSSKETAAEPNSELEFIKFKTAGMPVHWKIINTCVVWLPKTFIWLLMVDIGTVFLMETSDINGMIMNSVALAFILSLDELICESVMSPVTQYVLDNLEPYRIISDDCEASEHISDKDAFSMNSLDKQWSLWSFKFWKGMARTPVQLLMVGLLTAFFTAKYYFEHCHMDEDGSWISIPIKEPYSSEMPFLSFLLSPLPFNMPVKTGPTSWSMPSGT